MNKKFFLYLLPFFFSFLFAEEKKSLEIKDAKKELQKYLIDTIVNDKSFMKKMDQMGDNLETQLKKESLMEEKRLKKIIETQKKQIYDLKCKNDRLLSWNIDLSSKLQALNYYKKEDKKTINFALQNKK